MYYSDTGLNTGSYYGNGGVTGSTGSSYYGSKQKQASVSSLNNLSKINASSYASTYNQISMYLQDGETEKALELWEQLKDDVATSYASTNNNWYMDDGTIETQLENGFYATTGTTFESGLESEFTNSLKKSLFAGLGTLFSDDCSKEEYLAAKTGSDLTTKAKAKGILGAFCGGAASGAATGAGIGACVGTLPAPVFGTSVGAFAGAIIGGIAGGVVGVFEYVSGLFN